MNDEVKWVPVAEILRNLVSSCDLGDADEYSYDGDNTELLRVIISHKASDTGFMHLVESIMEHGFNEEGAIGWNGSELQNGHHRFVAAVLLCLDSVPTVEFWGSEWDDCPSVPAQCAHYSKTGDDFGLALEV